MNTETNKRFKQYSEEKRAKIISIRQDALKWESILKKGENSDGWVDLIINSNKVNQTPNEYVATKFKILEMFS